MNKKGQATQQFNWIFVIIAGGVILLLFLFVIDQVRESSEAKLSIQVLNGIDTILTGAESSKNTVKSIEVNNLFFLRTNCDEDSRLFIGDSSRSLDLEGKIVFTPGRVGAKNLFIATQEIATPFIIGNVLMMSDEKMLFVVYNPDNSEFLKEIYEELPSNISKIETNYFQTSFSQYNQIIVLSDKEKPLFSRSSETYRGVNVLKDSNVNWIKVTQTPLSATISTKEDRSTEFLEEESIQLPSISLIGLLAHSSNAKYYSCNIDKINERIKIISRVYEKRTTELLQEDSISAQCKTRYIEMNTALSSLKNADNQINQLTKITSIQNIHEGILLASCPNIY